jgi:hypothetical protein
MMFKERKSFNPHKQRKSDFHFNDLRYSKRRNKSPLVYLIGIAIIVYLLSISNSLNEKFISILSLFQK